VITLQSKLSNPILKIHRFSLKKIVFSLDGGRDDEQTCGGFSLSKDETHGGGGRNNLG